jgi:hypothetical protein
MKMAGEAKNLLLAGVPRSGKTMAARCIAGSLKLSHIPLDALVTAFQDNFPQHGIVHHNLTLEEICRNFLPFLTSLLKEMNYEGTYFCADSYHVSPEGANRLRNELGVRPIFLGYPFSTIEQKFAEIRSNAQKDDWTSQVPDDQLRKLIGKFISESILLKSSCDKFGIPFFDTGSDFNGALETVVRCAITNR